MGDESGLPARACEATEIGKLPDRRPDHVWGGPGSGTPCAVCGKVVDKGDVELELQFTSDGVSAAARYHVHAKCFGAWERERGIGASNGHTLPGADGGGIMPGRERNTTGRGERG